MTLITYPSPKTHNDAKRKLATNKGNQARSDNKLVDSIIVM
jgi:hypothetical protein